MFKHLKNLFSSRDTGANDRARLAAPNSLLVNAYCTVTSVPALPFPQQINGRRDLADPALRQHLAGFMGYVRSRGQGEMSSIRYHVLRHIQRIRVHLSFPVDDERMNEVTQWDIRQPPLVEATAGVR